MPSRPFPLASRPVRWPAAILLTGAFAIVAVTPLGAQADPGAAALANWRVTGDSPTLTADRTINLPAGAELSQTFVAGQVSVHLVTRPLFTAQSAGWPALEVGPASLTFVRDGSGGGAVLLGDQALALPYPIVLGSDGRSLENVDFTLTYDQPQNTATLLIDGRTFSLPASGAAGEVKVVIAAGAAATWPIASLSVQSTPVEPSPGAGNKDPGASTVSADHRIDRVFEVIDPVAHAAERKRVFSDAFKLFKKGDFTEAEATLFQANRSKPGTFGWQVESASKLTHMALSLRQKYDYKTSLTVTRRALAVLQEAEKLSGEAERRRQAHVHEMAAFLHDELLHDAVAARAEYRKAELINPQSVRTRDGLQRLDEHEAKTQRQATLKLTEAK